MVPINGFSLLGLTTLSLAPMVFAQGSGSGLAQVSTYTSDNCSLSSENGLYTASHSGQCYTFASQAGNFTIQYTDCPIIFYDDNACSYNANPGLVVGTCYSSASAMSFKVNCPGSSPSSSSSSSSSSSFVFSNSPVSTQSPAAPSTVVQTVIQSQVQTVTVTAPASSLNIPAPTVSFTSATPSSSVTGDASSNRCLVWGAWIWSIVVIGASLASGAVV